MANHLYMVGTFSTLALILFLGCSVLGFQGKKDLVAVDNTEYEGDEGEVEDSENEEIHEGPEHSSSDLDDSDEERKR